MPPKRKAAEIPRSDDDDDDGVNSKRSSKKAKRTLAERQAEARAKAKLYAATLKAKKEGLASSPAASSSSSPKPKRSRKSTGAHASSSDDGSVSSASRRRRSTGTSVAASRRKGRSAATTAALADGDFVFRPPETIAEEPATDTDESVRKEKDEQQDASVGPRGTPVRSPDYVEKSIQATMPHASESQEQNKSSEKKVKKNFMSPEETEARKKKKVEQLERARAYGERLMKKNSPIPLPSHDSSTSPLTASRNVTTYHVAASAATSTVASFPPVQIHAAAAAKPPSKSTAPSKSSAPPAALASIFAPTKKYIAHRPALLDKDSDSKKFDPNAPFPQRGYKLPTAAYCGCGPTPAYSKTVGAASVVGDVCLTDAVENAMSSGGQSGVTYRKRESYSSKLGHMNDGFPSVDPPFGRYKRESANDLEPLGIDVDVEEDTALKRPAVDPEPSVIPSRPPAETLTSPSVPSPTKRSPLTTSTATPTAAAHVNQSVLNASIAKARALVSSVSDKNRQRRAALGIKSDGGVASKTDTALVQMLREQTTNDVVDSRKAEEKIASLEPPAMENVVMENRSDVAEERVNVEQEENPINDDPSHPSFIKKMMNGVLSFFFVIMMFQLAFGAYYIASKFLLEPNTPLSNETKSWSPHSFLGREKPSAVEMTQHNCFEDHPAVFLHRNGTVDDEQCAGKYLKCPQWGRCHAGRLHDCEDGGSRFDGLLRFVPNQRGDECIPSKEVLDIIDFVKEALVSMTVVQHCNIWDKLGKGDVVISDENDHPLFQMEKVVEKMKNTKGYSILNGTDVSVDLLLWLQPVNSSVLRFRSSFGEEEGVMNSIGLATGVSPNSLPLPLMCSLRIMSLELFMLSLGAVAYLTKFAWYSLSTYTIPSVVFLVLFYIGNLYRKRRRRLEKINTLLEPVLEQVYDRLAVCDNNEGYAALMLRDDIGHDMYPTKLQEKKFLYNEVWPRVILEVHSDNRVRKFRKEANGKTLEHWDFHKQSKKGRLLRKSLGRSTQKLDLGTKNKSPTVSRDP